MIGMHTLCSKPAAQVIGDTCRPSVQQAGKMRLDLEKMKTIGNRQPKGPKIQVLAPVMTALKGGRYKAGLDCDWQPADLCHY